MSSSGSYYLDQIHAYHYHVQTQLFAVAVEYCAFCVCTFTDDEESGLFIERVVKNEGFWNDCILKAEIFFRTCAFPELVGGWYTKPKSSTYLCITIGSH